MSEGRGLLLAEVARHAGDQAGAPKKHQGYLSVLVHGIPEGYGVSVRLPRGTVHRDFPSIVRRPKIHVHGPQLARSYPSACFSGPASRLGSRQVAAGSKPSETAEECVTVAKRGPGDRAATLQLQPRRPAPQFQLDELSGALRMKKWRPRSVS